MASPTWSSARRLRRSSRQPTSANGETNMRKEWKLYLMGIATLALGLISTPASATECDFITGGGYIVRPTGEKANFGVGGGCRKGQFWGHLQYIDRSFDPPLKVHWL